MKQRNNRLKNKKTFLITGGRGFIGSHFVDAVLLEGHKVINIDKLTYASNDIKFVGDYTFIKKDIVNIKNIHPCYFIINFAAESHVDNSIESSFSFIRSNVLGVHNILEIIKNQKIFNMQKAWEYSSPLFVQISTDEVFGDVEIGERGFLEEDRHKPSNPYSASKSAAEQLVVAWSRTYDIPYIITRTTNNYGPRQHGEKLIPCVVKSLINGNKIPVHGSGEYIRNWIHVKDNVNAIMTIVDRAEANQSYHIASDEEYSVKQIIEMFCKPFGKTFNEVADFSNNRSGADVRYALECDELKKLGWKQNNNLKKSIEKIITSYKKDSQ